MNDVQYADDDEVMRIAAEMAVKYRRLLDRLKDVD